MLFAVSSDGSNPSATSHSQSQHTLTTATNNNMESSLQTHPFYSQIQFLAQNNYPYIQQLIAAQNHPYFIHFLLLAQQNYSDLPQLIALKNQPYFPQLFSMQNQPNFHDLLVYLLNHPIHPSFFPIYANLFINQHAQMIFQQLVTPIIAATTASQTVSLADASRPQKSPIANASSARADCSTNNINWSAAPVKKLRDRIYQGMRVLCLLLCCCPFPLRTIFLFCFREGLTSDRLATGGPQEARQVARGVRPASVRQWQGLGGGPVARSASSGASVESSVRARRVRPARARASRERRPHLAPVAQQGHRVHRHGYVLSAHRCSALLLSLPAGSLSCLCGSARKHCTVPTLGTYDVHVHVHDTKALESSFVTSISSAFPFSALRECLFHL